jgi:hypothetical protein
MFLVALASLFTFFLAVKAAKLMTAKKNAPV